jgi:hypothetical protein
VNNAIVRDLPGCVHAEKGLTCIATPGRQQGRFMPWIGTRSNSDHVMDKADVSQGIEHRKGAHVKRFRIRWTATLIAHICQATELLGGHWVSAPVFPFEGRDKTTRLLLGFT